MGLMNKILLVLIIISGFLLIFYANNDIFTRTQRLFQGRNVTSLDVSPEDPSAQPEHLLLMDEAIDEEDSDEFTLGRRKAWNRTTFNLFVIYTKETEVLQKKFELLLKSLFKYTSISLHLHIITDAKSTYQAEKIARTQMERYHRHATISLLDVEDCVDKIRDIVQAMMPHFSSHPGRDPSGSVVLLLCES